MTHDPGLYVSAHFDRTTYDNLNRFVQNLQIENTVPPGKFHTTIVYSRRWVPLKPAIYRENIDPRSYKWKVFGTPGLECLVLTFESEVLHSRWKEAIGLGATWDHNGYQPHVTITYDARDINVDSLPLPEFPLVIKDELHKANDENWSAHG